MLPNHMKVPLMKSELFEFRYDNVRGPHSPVATCAGSAKSLTKKSSIPVNFFLQLKDMKI